jgi:uncharacterized membrane protein
MRALLPILLTGLGVVWLLLLVLAPFAPREASLVYAFAAGICHQQPERSFYLAAAALPVCARCFGLYASGAIAAVVAMLSRARDGQGVDSRTARIVFAAAAVPTIVSVAAEWLGLVSTSNLTRFAASLPLGAAAGWLFVRMLRADTSRSEPRRASAAPASAGRKE